MTMQNLHLEVLNMMERVRAKVDLCYGVRIQRSSRAFNGYVFLGNDNYIWVPICPLPIPENKTRAVGIVFHIERGELTESWIEFAIPKLQSKVGVRFPTVIPVLQKALPSGSYLRSLKWYDRWYLRLVTGSKTTQTTIKQTETQLTSQLPQILKVLSANRTSFPSYTSIYDRTLMKWCFERLLEIRKGLTDATDQLLMVVWSSL